MKVALITGGSRGIGKSTALECAKRGIGIVLTYHMHPEQGEEVAARINREGGKAVALKLDSMNINSFQEFTEALANALKLSWGRSDLDFLVNNAGIGQRTLMKDTTSEQFDQLMAVNLRGPFFLTQKLLPLIRDGGQIINISSALSRVTFPGVAVYAAFKSALETLTRYMAAEYADRRIRVNCVAPGAIDTEFGGGKGDDEARGRIATITALKRLGQPDEVGRFIASLLAEDHPFLTAQRIELSGGIAL